MTTKARIIVASSILVSLLSFAGSAGANLNPVNIFNGHVGVSIDGTGSNSSPVGSVQASIPIGANILQAYLYSVGTPAPWYSNSPTTAAQYNSAGITLAGNAVTNFDTIIGATSDRPEIGRWYTGRADVTSLVRSLASGGPSYNWSVNEGNALNNRIDGEVLVVVYEDPNLASGSVVLLDGGQRTGGETTTVGFASPLANISDPNFFANMSLGISFSTGDTQHSVIDINASRLSSAAGGYDDGGLFDGGLITVGGIGDLIANPADAYSSSSYLDDELYNLVPFLNNGDTGFSISTSNGTNDDNIFFMALHQSIGIGQVNDVVVDPVPEPATILLVGGGLAGLAIWRRKRPALCR